MKNHQSTIFFFTESSQQKFQVQSIERKNIKNNIKTTKSHLATTSIPQVNTIPQSHSQDIVRRPIHKIQIKIILQCRSIQNLKSQNHIQKN